MSGRTRFFVNNADDYENGTHFSVDFKQIKDDIMDNVYNCVKEQKRTHRGIDGGLYVGTYGNGYTLWHLSRKNRFSTERDDLLSAAVELMKCGLEAAKQTKSKDASDECGFLLGKAGIYAVGAAVFFEAGQDSLATDCIKEYINASRYCIPLSYASFGGDELFVGRAGYLCGALWLNRIFKRPVISDQIIHSVCDSLIKSGKDYAKASHSKSHLMYSYYDTEYLGAAHGLCAILQMLLSCKSYLEKHPEVVDDIKASVNYYLSIQMPNGNFPTATDEVGQSRGRDELVHWCHGAPGVVYLLLKAYLFWHEPMYLDSALKCGEIVWKKGLLKKGPGICHGIGGNAYVFLLLYRVTQDKKHLYRANEFAKFLKTDDFKHARVPDNPYSLYEGFAGTMSFLADLMEPQDAAFPFFEIF